VPQKTNRPCKVPQGAPRARAKRGGKSAPRPRQRGRQGKPHRESVRRCRARQSLSLAATRRLSAPLLRFDGRGCGSSGLQGLDCLSTALSVLAFRLLPTAFLLLAPWGSGTCCLGNDPRLSMLRSRAGAWSAPYRHIRQVPPAGGRIPIEVAAPWPFTAALHDLRVRLRTPALEDPRSVRSPSLSF
jgi:hypothetical protein